MWVDLTGYRDTWGTMVPCPSIWDRHRCHKVSDKVSSSHALLWRWLPANFNQWFPTGQFSDFKTNSLYISCLIENGRKLLDFDQKDIICVVSYFLIKLRVYTEWPPTSTVYSIHYYYGSSVGLDYYTQNSNLNRSYFSKYQSNHNHDRVLSKQKATINILRQNFDFIFQF